jgi:hypothetical protein
VCRDDLLQPIYLGRKDIKDLVNLIASISSQPQRKAHALDIRRARPLGQEYRRQGGHRFDKPLKRAADRLKASTARSRMASADSYAQQHRGAEYDDGDHQQHVNQPALLMMFGLGRRNLIRSDKAIGLGGFDDDINCFLDIVGEPNQVKIRNGNGTVYGDGVSQPFQ